MIRFYIYVEMKFRLCVQLAYREQRGFCVNSMILKKHFMGPTAYTHTIYMLEVSPSRVLPLRDRPIKSPTNCHALFRSCSENSL